MTTLEKLQSIHFDENKFWMVARGFDASKYGLEKSDIPQLLEIGGRISDYYNSEVEDDDSTDWATSSFALSALQQLKSEEGLHLVYRIANQQDFAEFEGELLLKFSESNPEALLKLAEEFFLTSAYSTRNYILEGVGKIAASDSEKIGRIEQFFAENLKHYQDLDKSNNGFLVGGLIEIGKGKEHYDLIKEVYRIGKADISIRGDLEDIEIELGMRTERETPKPDLFADLRAKLTAFKKDYRKNDKGAKRKALSSTGRKKVNLKKLKKKKK